MAGRQMQSTYVTREGAAQKNNNAIWESVVSCLRLWRDSKSSQTSPGIISYGTIILAILLTAGAQALASQLLDDHAQFLLFIPAVLTAAFLGGFRVGVLVTMLSLAATLSSLGETEGNDLRHLVNALAFGAVAVGLSAFGDAMHHWRREARARNLDLTSIIEAIPGAMLVFDASGTVRQINRTAEHFFGYRVDEIVGRKADLLLGDGFTAQCQLSTGMGRPGGVTCKAVGQRKDGSRFPMELVLSEARIGGGRHFTGLAIDLTDRQNTHAQLEALQGEMIHASRLSLMGTMASAMAHELNQPLSAITNYVKGLKHAAARDEVERPVAFATILDKTADQALRAGQIIGRLRDLTVRGETERRLEDFVDLVEEACALAFPGTREHGVQIALDHEREGDVVLVDRVQIQQVLLNLIRNAGEAMADADRRVLTISTTVDDNDMLIVRVEDTGHGVAADLVPRLFAPFVTTKRDGMGIGLSISRMIVESHGGDMWYAAAPDGGAAFCFSLPRVAQSELENAA